MSTNRMSVIFKSDGLEQVLKLIFLLLFMKIICLKSNHILRCKAAIFINYVTEFANYITMLKKETSRPIILHIAEKISLQELSLLAGILPNYSARAESDQLTLKSIS